MKEIVIRKDKGVSAIVGTILIVAITVVLAATVYGVLTGFGGLISGGAPNGAISVSQSGTTYTVSFTQLSKNVSLSNVELKISTATNTYIIGPGLSTTSTATFISGNSGPSYNLTVSTTGTLSISTVLTLNIGYSLTSISVVDTSPSGTIATWSA